MRRVSTLIPRGRCFALMALVAVCLAAFGNQAARAGTGPSQPTVPGQTVIVPTGSLSSYISQWSGSRHVPGYRLTPAQAIARAEQIPRIRAYLLSHPGLKAAALPAQVSGRAWDVMWISGNTREIDATVDERTGAVWPVWFGVQAEWSLARGYSWYSGNLLGDWYVWVPLCLLFMLPFVDRRRPLRALHLDLLALLGFSVSFFFFRAGNVSASIPLVYPVLAYLLGRMLWLGLRPRRTGQALIPHFRTSWLVVGIVLIMALRIGANLADSTVLDVGDAGVAGAHLLAHRQPLYNGTLGLEIIGGDTYGPVNYLAYVPSAALFPHDKPWVGKQSVDAHNPAAQIPAILFDLLTLVGLVLLGRRLRAGPAGTRLGLALGWAWAAYPLSALALMENTNDSLLAALIVFAFVFLASPAKRGVMLALATLAKFVPLILIPLLATATTPRRLKPMVIFGLAFALTACVAVLPFVSPDELHAFYHATVGAQLHRTSPISIWGQHASLHTLRLAVEAGTVVLALAVAFFPRVRTQGQVLALGAALLIAFEACLVYWYYTYVVWFAPLAFAAMFLVYETGAFERSAREPDTSFLYDAPPAERIPEAVV